MRRRTFLETLLIGGAITNFDSWTGSAQNTTGAKQRTAADRRGPIIDVHMHAYPADGEIPTSGNPATGKPPGVKTGEAHLQACLAEMKRLNIVRGVVSGGDGDRLAAAAHWHDSAPDRIIAAAGVRGSADTPLPEVAVLRKAFAEGRLRVLGEVTAEYAGLTLSDMK